MRRIVLAIAVGALFAAATPLAAAEFQKTFKFAVDEWHEIESTDGAVTLHRIRLNPKEGRSTRSAVLRPFNHEYLSTLQVQLEYTNGTERKWRARVAVRWLDEEGRIIDGFSGNEGLEKKSARKLTEMSVPTLKYGLEAAKTLEVDINFEP